APQHFSASDCAASEFRRLPENFAAPPGLDTQEAATPPLTLIRGSAFSLADSGSSQDREKKNACSDAAARLRAVLRLNPCELGFI
ncbi:MAG TPA: hypothetical protein VNH64_01215, partial [Parvularculaceae bacterium]|nr:hypothetical protein [Parvularculaceae bacterium]